MKPGYIFAVVLIVFMSSVFFMIGGCSHMVSSVSSGGAMNLSSSPLGLVKMSGPIMDPLPVLEQLQKLQQDNQIKGILIRVDSPGGAVGAAQEINSMIEWIVGEGKPVVVSYGNVSASGGVYSTLAATTIFANPGTITGSIGVILQFPQGYELMEKIGVNMVTVASGESKDAGSPYRQATAEDLKLLQGTVQQTYSQFKAQVHRLRNISNDTLDKYADGRILTGEQAYQIGLVDSLGGYQSALKHLATLCDLPVIPEQLKEIKPAKPFIRQLLEEPVSQIKNYLGAHTRVLYQMP
jgi:protease IV